MTNQTQQTTQYFNIHTHGLGYVNRIREVKPENGGKPFWSCTVAVLRGASDNVKYTYIDCRVSGEEALSLVKRLKKTVDEAIKEGKAEPKLLIGFTIGDIYPESFTYESGDKKGKTGVNIKGRLLRISSIKKDGEMVYQSPKKEEIDPEGLVDNIPAEHPEQAQPQNDVPETPVPTEQPAQEEAEEMAAF